MKCSLRELCHLISSWPWYILFAPWVTWNHCEVIKIKVGAESSWWQRIPHVSFVLVWCKKQDFLVPSIKHVVPFLNSIPLMFALSTTRNFFCLSLFESCRSSALSSFCFYSSICFVWPPHPSHCFSTACLRFFYATSKSVTVGTDVIGGDVTLSTVSPNRQSRKVVQVISHPSYRVDQTPYDIALVRLNLPLVMTDYVQPACLTTEAEETDLFGSNVCRVAGWGVIIEDRAGERLLKVIKYS